MGEQDFSFRNISVKDGLSESTIKVILEDKKGLLYFGTENGLDIYNGYEFKNFQMDSFNDSSMLGNKVSYLYEDSKGMIWIGTELGISKYDPAFNEFSRPIKIDSSITHDENGKQIWSHRPNYIVEDKNGDIWFNLVDNGYLFHYSISSDITTHLTKYDTTGSHPFNEIDHVDILFKDKDNILWFVTRTLKEYDKIKGPLNNYGLYQTSDGINGIKPYMLNGSIFDYSVNIIKNGKDNVLWIGTDKGLFELTDGLNGKVNIYKKTSKKNSIISDNVKYIDWDNAREKLWIATNDGISCYIPSENNFYNLQVGPFANSIIENDIKELLIAEKSGMLWYTTENFDGFNCLSITADTSIGYQDTSIMNIVHDPVDPTSIADNDINTFIEDRSGHIWIGTAGNGVSFYSFYKPKFSHWQYDQDNEWSIKNNKVYSITPDPYGMVWAATGHGLELLSNDGLRDLDFELSALDINNIMDIELAGDRYLWIASEKGVLRLDIQSDDLYKPEINEVFNMDIAYDLMIGDNGRLIASTGESGLVFIDTSNMQIDHDYEYTFGRDVDWAEYLWFEGPIRVISQDMDGNLWLGTDQNGIFRVPHDQINNWFTNRANYKYDKNRPDGLSSSTITCISQDQTGGTWIGTNNGLNKYQKETDSFIHYFVDHGLPSNYITAILPDDKNNLWISSKKGISLFDQTDTTFTNYGLNDGIGNLDFHRNSYAISNEGHIFFGGPNGVTKFYPKDLQYNTYQPPCIITSITETFFDDSVNEIFLPMDIASYNKVPNISINHKVKSFTVDFVALNYHQTIKNKYRYKLVPFDRDWIDARGARFANYNNLGRSEYTFMVQGSNDDGLWSEPLSLGVKFIPHPLLSYWAFSIYTIILIIGIFLFIRHRMDKQKSQLEEERRIQEMEQARDFQMSLIPQSPPDHPDYDIALHMKTSTEVGGDYYDFFPQEDGSMYVVCGDATGHGLNAGMMVSITKAGLYGSNFDTPASTTTRLNRTIKAIDLGTTRMSLNMAKFHNGSFDFTSAGMPPAYLYKHSEKEADEILVPGLPLGSMKKADFDLHSFNLESNDALVLISDGLPECVNHEGEMLDYEPVKECIAANGNKSAQGIIDSLIDLGDEWMSGLMNDDDITLVVIKKK